MRRVEAGPLAERFRDDGERVADRLAQRVGPRRRNQGEALADQQRIAESLRSLARVLLIPGWLRLSRLAARVTLRSSISASNATRRLRSTPVRSMLP